MELIETFKSSPDHIRISMAAAIELGLKPGLMYRGAKCPCINLLLNYEAGCYATCTYCGLARERPGLAAENTFIRVGWPVIRTEDIARTIGENTERVGRVCIAMVHHPRAYEDTLTVTRQVLAHADVPISGLVMATLLNEERLLALKEAGIDIIGLGLDAASEEVFGETRGRGANGPHSWAQHWEIVTLAREIFGPKNVNCHVVVGLGETDRELVDLFHRCRSIEVEAYLFSFNPEPGTVMEDVPRAPIERLRRVQLVKHLIEDEGLPKEAVEFGDKGEIVYVDAPKEIVDRLIVSGTPFMTDGCPDRKGEVACNRPFGSYKPGEEFRDYPFQPTESDLIQIRREMGVAEILTERERV